MYSLTRRVLFVPLFLSVILAACLGSTGANESCEDHDRQAEVEYLTQNAQKAEVTETDSGLQYRIIEAGDGPTPASSDSVEVEFTGRLIDGSIFDSTENLPGPLRFKIKDFSVDGVREGLYLMEEGSTYELVLPSDLGFGETASGSICPGTTLIFEITLVNIF